jgi:FkbM family methyltransferase
MAIPILDELNQCQVVSFEPSPLSFSCLSRTARESRFRDRWKVVGKALGRQEGDLEFCTSSDGFDAFNGFKNTKRVDSKESIIVSVSTLDGEWEKMGNPHVSAIKIDVEGAEMEVLSGALLCINHERPAILVEWNLLNITPYNLLPSSLLEFTRSINYNLYSVPMMVPIKDETMLNVSMLKTESFLLFPCKN